MVNIEIGLRLSEEIKAMAIEAAKNLSPSQTTAYQIARKRIRRPVDYMRYAEFDAILRDLNMKSQMVVLDIGSPQWFSLWLASKYNNIELHYMNIIDAEIDPYIDIAQSLGLNNIFYKKGDVREVQFSANTFDRVFSISVIEHIYPEIGGDLKALSEIFRVLKPNGEFLFTVPYKSRSNIVYVDGAVYEREAKTKNFFAREYDSETFNTLIEKSDFSLVNSWFICERKGIFPLDYYEWGPGSNLFFTKYLIKIMRYIEKMVNTSIDNIIAKQYLSVSQEVTGRLVNISVKLAKL